MLNLARLIKIPPLAGPSLVSCVIFSNITNIIRNTKHPRESLVLLIILINLLRLLRITQIKGPSSDILVDFVILSNIIKIIRESPYIPANFTNNNNIEGESPTTCDIIVEISIHIGEAPLSFTIFINNHKRGGECPLLPSFYK